MNIELPTPDDVRIVSGAESSEHVSRWKTFAFARQLSRSIRDTAPVRCSRIREHFRTILSNFVTERTANKIYPYPTTLEAIRSIYQDIRKMLRDRTLLTAIVNGQVAGIGGYMELPGQDNGTRLVEMRRTVIDPAFRGQKIYPRLADRRLEEITQRMPEHGIANATRQPSVIRWCTENAFTEIDWRHFYMQLKQVMFSPSEERAFDERVRLFGWKYFERGPATSSRPAESRST
jgi:GNAT superfamily N-acetyltransferase